MHTQVKIKTDTATVCLFDPDLLRNRLTDVADWWTDPHEEIVQVNSGNMLTIGLGMDGLFIVDVYIREHPPISKNKITARIKCVSGRFYIGPGEDITGEGVEPGETSTGTFLQVEAGTWLVDAFRTPESSVSIYLNAVQGEATNAFTEILEIG